MRSHPGDVYDTKSCPASDSKKSEEAFAVVRRRAAVEMQDHRERPADSGQLELAETERPEEVEKEEQDGCCDCRCCCRRYPQFGWDDDVVATFRGILLPHPTRWDRTLLEFARTAPRPGRLDSWLSVCDEMKEEEGSLEALGGGRVPEEWEVIEVAPDRRLRA